MPPWPKPPAGYNYFMTTTINGRCNKRAVACGAGIGYILASPPGRIVRAGRKIIKLSKTIRKARRKTKPTTRRRIRGGTKAGTIGGICGKDRNNCLKNMRKLARKQGCTTNNPKVHIYEKKMGYNPGAPNAVYIFEC